MLWLTVTATVTATVRLLLIVTGLWLTIQSISDRFHLTCCSYENRRKFFLVASVIYLLGLLPHSLLLFPVFSSVSSPVHFRPECDLAQETKEGTICWTQRLSCSVAVGIHIVLCFACVTEPLLAKVTATGNCSFLRRVLLSAVIASCLLVLLWQSFYLWPDENKLRWKYFDFQKNEMLLLNDCDNNATQNSLLLESSTQAVQVQLLLCEEYVTSNDVENYLVCSIICGLPVLLFVFGLRRLHASSDFTYFNGETDVWKPEGTLFSPSARCLCTTENPCLDAAFNFASLVIALWILIMRPLVMAFNAMFSEYFVDFGTHILLTICVLLPATFTCLQEKTDTKPCL